VPDPEHRAAKAGRLVRAVGLGVARELEKRANAPPKARPEPPPPPPPVPTGGLVGTAVFYAFIVGVGALLLVLLKVASLVHGTPQLVARLTLGGLLLVEAVFLTSNWQLANQRIGQRVLNRIWGPRGAANRRERFIANRVRDVLTLVGIAFLAAGVFEILNAFIKS
jgi:hypothetical protein